MVRTEKELEDMFDEIGHPEMVFYDILVPEENDKYGLLGPLDKESPWYWIPNIEGQVESIYRYIERVLSPLGVNRESYLDYRGLERAIVLSFENAYMHGNKGWNYAPISMKILQGENGFVVRIRDYGFRDGDEIFDYDLILNEGRFKHQGVGFREMKDMPQEFNLEGNGSVINILVKYRVDNIEEA